MPGRGAKLSVACHVRKSRVPAFSVRAPVARVGFPVIARFGNDGQRESLSIGQERRHRGHCVLVADHRQVRQSLAIHVGQVEIGLDSIALKESRDAAPGQLFFGERGCCRR